MVMLDFRFCHVSLHFTLFMLGIMDWIVKVNTESVLDPSNSVIKRVWCIYTCTFSLEELIAAFSVRHVL